MRPGTDRPALLAFAQNVDGSARSSPAHIAADAPNFPAALRLCLISITIRIAASSNRSTCGIAATDLSPFAGKHSLDRMDKNIQMGRKRHYKVPIACRRRRTFLAPQILANCVRTSADSFRVSGFFLASSVPSRQALVRGPLPVSINSSRPKA
jgi:hypothetical protein